MLQRVPRMISRAHAKILRKPCATSATGFEYEVVDSGSLNGVYVNDIKIQAVSLKDGDVIVFGGKNGNTLAFGRSLVHRRLCVMGVSGAE